jgi:isorenieratene synthase
MAKKIVIVGGGIAGLVTAYTLLKQGKKGERPFDVTILEAESVPGGQARGFKIQPKAPAPFGEEAKEIPGEKPFTVEHGSHVFFKFYDTIIKLIEELRSDPEIGKDMPEFSPVPGWTIVDAYGHRALLKQGSILPEPYNVFPSILGISWLPIIDRVRIGLGSIALIDMPYDRFGELDQKTALELGLECGYSELGLLAWNSASLGLTNLFIQEQSGAIFCAKHKVLISEPDGLSYKLPAGDLSDLIPNPLRKKIDRLGGTLITGATVSTIRRPTSEPRTKVTYEKDGARHEIEGDHVILTVPPSTAAPLVPWVKAPWAELQKVTPVVTVVMRLSGLLEGSPDNRELGLSREQWAFSVVTDLSRFWPEYEGTNKTVLRCEIGHADRFPSGPDTSDEEIMRLIEQDLVRLFYPEYTDKKLKIEAFAIHRETKHLYTRWVRGQWSKKPKERDVGQGVFLAGDWTTKGTIGMEAAANSGIEAANHVLLASGMSPVPFRDIPL